jgi:DivIVA domain-containing protein
LTLTPLDIEKAVFRRGFMGYRCQEVDRLLAEVSRTLEEHLTQLAQQQSRLSQLEAELARYRDNEQLLSNNAALAQRTADELVAAARERATGIKREAELEAEQLKQSLETLRSERLQFESAFQGLLADFMQKLTAGTTAPPALPSVPRVQPQPAVHIPLRSGPASVASHWPERSSVEPEPAAPRITLEPGLVPRAAVAPEPSRAELIDMLSGAGGMQSRPDSDTDELERILAATQLGSAPAAPEA